MQASEELDPIADEKVPERHLSHVQGLVTLLEKVPFGQREQVEEPNAE